MTLMAFILHQAVAFYTLVFVPELGNESVTIPVLRRGRLILATRWRRGLGLGRADARGDFWDVNSETGVRWTRFQVR